ncbi:MAG: MerR family transcriptional regulator [Acidimicrobiales bacterium]
MRIGELAKCCGASVQTLRFYEREGILRQPPRTDAGYRAYTATDVEHVRFVRDCQSLGFSLADIRQLSSMHGLGPAERRGATGTPPARARFLQLSRERMAHLDAKIEELQALRRQIAGLVGAAERMDGEGCPAAKKKA